MSRQPPLDRAAVQINTATGMSNSERDAIQQQLLTDPDKLRVLNRGKRMEPYVIDLLSEETGLPVLVAEDPLSCVVRGCGMALDHLDRQGGIFTSEP